MLAPISARSCSRATLKSSLSHCAGVRPIRRANIKAMASSINADVKVKVGDRLPGDEVFTVLDWDAPLSDMPKDVKVKEIISGKKVVLFGLPGAFTGTCSSKHVPEYNKLQPKLKELGVELVACISVNDAYVMREWAKVLQIDPTRVSMLADWAAKFNTALGLTQELPGLGLRSLRWSMFVDDGTVKILNVDEPGPTSYKVSGPEKMIKDIEEIQKQ